MKGSASMRVQRDKVPTDLIPGLPDDVAMECLIRVSGRSHPQMQGVCSRWEGLVRSGELYEQRRQAGILHQHLCMLQASPRPATTGTDAVTAIGTCRHRDRTGQTDRDRDRVTGRDAEPDTESADTDMFMRLSVFDPLQGSWEWLPLIEDFPHSLPLFCQCVAIHEKLYLLGGWHPSTYETLSSLYIFDFSSRQWSRGADLPEARSFFACATLGGNVIVAGGHDDQKNALNTAEMYLPEENRWQRLPAMSQERDECFGISAGGQFFAVSGYGTDTQGQFMRSVDVYDPEDSTWHQIENFWMTELATSPHTVTGCSVYAFLRNQLFQYSFVEKTWRLIDELPFHGKVAACFWAPNGKELLIKGTYKRQGWVCAYKPPKEGSLGNWRMLHENEADFTGVVYSSCTIEI